MTTSKIMATGNKVLRGSGRGGREVAEYNITVKCVTELCAMVLD
jgi:hypothetical protein